MDMTNITPVNEDKKEQINNGDDDNGREKEIEIEKLKFLDRNLKKFLFIFHSNILIYLKFSQI